MERQLYSLLILDHVCWFSRFARLNTLPRTLFVLALALTRFYSKPAAYRAWVSIKQGNGFVLKATIETPLTSAWKLITFHPVLSFSSQRWNKKSSSLTGQKYSMPDWSSVSDQSSCDFSVKFLCSTLTRRVELGDHIIYLYFTNWISIYVKNIIYDIIYMTISNYKILIFILFIHEHFFLF